MATSDNEKVISDFISSFFCESHYTQLCNSTNNIILADEFINDEARTEITWQGAKALQDCSYEEADTRIIYHVIEVDKNF